MATFSLAHAKEAADTDYDGRDLAVLSKHDVIDLADRLVGGIRDLRADELAGAHLTWLMRVELTIGGGGRARLCLGFGRLRDLGDASSWATLFDAGKASRLSHRPGCFFWLARGTTIATGFASRLALPTAGSWVSQCRGSTVMPSISSSLRIAKDFSLSRSRSPLMSRSRTIFANRSRLTRMLKPCKGPCLVKGSGEDCQRLLIEGCAGTRHDTLPTAWAQHKQ